MFNHAPREGRNLANEGLENGKPYRFSGERARECGRKGGRNKGVNARFRKLAEMMFSAPAKLTEENKKTIREFLGIGDDETVTNRMLYLSKLNALLGGTKTRPEVFLSAFGKAIELDGQDAATEIAKEKIKLEKERIKLERERIALERERMQLARGVSEDVPAPVIIDDIPEDGNGND